MKQNIFYLIVVGVILPFITNAQKSGQNEELQRIIAEQQIAIKKLEIERDKDNFFINSGIISITEIDQNHKAYFNKPVVDINSDLIVKIDKDYLKKRVASELNQDEVSGLIELIVSIQNLEETNKRILESTLSINKSFKRIDRNVSYAEQMKNISQIWQSPPAKMLANEADKFLEYISENNPKLAERAENRFLETEDIFDEYEIIYDIVDDQISEYKKDLNQIIKSQGYYFRMAGWLITKTGNVQIHLPGFDVYESQDAVEIDRFNITLSNEQKTELKKLEGIANEINEDGFSKFFEILSESVSPNIEIILNSVNECMNEISSDLENLESVLGGSADLLKSKISSELNNIDEFQDFLEEVKKRYTKKVIDKSSSELLIQTNEDILLIKSKIEEIVNSINLTGAELESELTGATELISSAFDKFTLTFDRCQKEVISSALNSIAGIKMMIYNLKGAKSLNLSVLEFTDKVVKHDIDQLPSESRFPLITTGNRKKGDSVILKLVAGKEGLEDELTMDYKYIKLFQVLFHLETTVSMVFIDNLSAGEEGDPLFVAAPSYSVLFVKGSRKSVGANEFGQVNFGLNIAAPDLDQNGPDIAIGGTVAFLKNIIQLGGGYDITAEKPYWFFGIRLPFISLNPLSPDGQVMIE